MANYGVFKAIPPYDFTRTTFRTYKQWQLTKQNFLSASFVTDDHISVYSYFEPNINLYPGGIVPYSASLGSTDPINTSTSNGYVSPEFNNSAIYYLLRHQYYTNPYTNNSFGNTDPEYAIKNLYESGSVISIPQRYYGEEIKPGSVFIDIDGINVSGTGSIQLSIIDDKQGNLVDTKYSSSVALESRKLYLGFNESRYKPNANTNFIFAPVLKYDVPFSNYTVSNKNIEIVNSDIIDTYYAGVSGSVGLASRFTWYSSYVRIQEQRGTTYLSPEKDDDFSISLWIFVENPVPGSGSNDPYSYIVSKRKLGERVVATTGATATSVMTVNPDYPYNTNKFPFELRIAAQSGSTTFGSISNTNTLTSLEAVRSDGTNTIVLSGSIQTGVNGPVYKNASKRCAYHVVYQKTGSMLELYIDGVLIDSKPDNVEFNFNNKCDIFLGNLDTSLYYGPPYSSFPFADFHGLLGTIDEFQLFRRALTQEEITILSAPQHAVNSNVIGNVFYSHGIINISDTRPKYKDLSKNIASWNTISGSQPGGPGAFNKFNLWYKSTQPIEEVEVLCRIREDEFTFTSNPTILEDYRSQKVAGFVTSSYFKPYITTIGLYNDSGSLVATGKLASPISKILDADLNFLVRFDI
jgi:hypothetical protein